MCTVRVALLSAIFSLPCPYTSETEIGGTEEVPQVGSAQLQVNLYPGWVSTELIGLE